MRTSDQCVAIRRTRTFDEVRAGDALPELKIPLTRTFIVPTAIASRDCDHFTPPVLPQLEELGFCARGEAREFIRDGHLELDGELPTNAHGGQLGEAYLHGMNGIAEAVRLVRGASVNQPEDVRNVVVTAGTGVPTSGLVLGAE